MPESQEGFTALIVNLAQGDGRASVFSAELALQRNGGDGKRLNLLGEPERQTGDVGELLDGPGAFDTAVVFLTRQGMGGAKLHSSEATQRHTLHTDARSHFTDEPTEVTAWVLQPSVELRSVSVVTEDSVRSGDFPLGEVVIECQTGSGHRLMKFAYRGESRKRTEE